MKNKKLSAFSLIELSIVLIIIGLLVAGITGGQSLIESARARAVMNEARGYMQAVNTYFVANGRLPGDPDNTGKTGGYSGNDITESDYDIDSEYGDEYIAPWFDLNRESIADYDEDDEISEKGKESKYIKKAIYVFTHADEDWPNYTQYQEEFTNKNLLKLDARYDGYIPSRIALNIEEKMDDKSFDTGSIRTERCSNSISNSYDESDGNTIRDEGDYGYVSYEDLADVKNGACDEIVFKLDL